MKKLERVARIELAALAWKAKVLPLYDTRIVMTCLLCHNISEWKALFLKTKFKRTTNNQFHINWLGCNSTKDNSVHKSTFRLANTFIDELQ